MMNFYHGMMGGFPFSWGMDVWGAALWFWWVAIAWSLVWKGLALWRAAERKESAWFVVLLVVNTLGFLELVYLFLIAPRRRRY